MTIKYLDQLTDLKGKKVFIRADFNVPLDKNGNITDDLRIRASLPTIEYVRQQGGKVIASSHLGRPKGKVNPEMSLKPIARRLGELLKTEVKMAPDCIGTEVEKLAAGLAPGEVLLLENLRFHPEEEKNDPAFARQLAALAEVYVDDAFACAHRAHASVEGIVHHIPIAAAGFLLKNEVEYFKKSMETPARPLVALIGGAKVSTKIGVLKNLLNKVDKLILGGAMALSFNQAQGNPTGQSKVEAEMIPAAKEILELAKQKNVPLLLPEDYLVAAKAEAGTAAQVVNAGAIPADRMALDIGPQTIKLFQTALSDAKTVIWNGPMGLFEIKDFSAGTIELARFLGQQNAVVVVGGGDTDVAVHQAGVAERMSYISTGGGAFLEMMEGLDLPGVKVLREKG